MPRKMDNILYESDQFIQIVKPFMILSGIWKLHLNIRKFYKDHYHFYTISFQTIFVVFLILLFAKLIQLLLIHANLEAIYSNLAIFVSTLAVGVKIMIYQKYNVPQMFEGIQKEEMEVLQSEDEDVKIFYMNQVKHSKNINMGIMIYVFFAMGSMFIIGLLRYIQDDKTISKSDKQQLEESFMYPFWLPFKEKSNMSVVIFLNILFAVVAIIIYCVSQMMFATLMLFATTQLRILQIRISKLQFNNIDDVGEQNATKVYSALRSLAVRHSYLIKSTRTLNESTKYIMLADFTLNSLNLASVAIQVLSITNLKDMVFPVSYLGVLVLQVFVLGWLANEIKIQSVAIGDALLTTNWYNQSVKFKNIILIFLLRTQKPLTMNIGPFGAMTTETALGTMQAAYSYITLMRNYE